MVYRHEQGGIFVLAQRVRGVLRLLIQPLTHRVAIRQTPTPRSYVDACEDPDDEVSVAASVEAGGSASSSFLSESFLGFLNSYLVDEVSLQSPASAPISSHTNDEAVSAAVVGVACRAYRISRRVDTRLQRRLADIDDGSLGTWYLMRRGQWWSLSPLGHGDGCTYTTISQ